MDDKKFCSYVAPGKTSSCNREPKYVLEYEGWLPACACSREHLAELVRSDQGIDSGPTTIRLLK